MEEHKVEPQTGVSAPTAAPPCTDGSVQQQLEFVVYRRRWLVLGLYVLFCMANAMQWVQYAIIADVIVQYYGVSYSAVNWTSLVYMLVYIVLIFPATWLYNKIGLRWTLLMGSLGNCLGAWIKVASVSPDRFWVTLVGQITVAAAQVYVMSTPAAVAAAWFGPEQISTACAIGVFGMQFGNALGFLIPPLMVTGDSNEEIGHDLSVMFYMIAIFTSILLILTAIYLEAAPPSPPSAAEAGRLQDGGPQETPRQFLLAIWGVLRQRDFFLLFVANGINVGVFCAFVTFINQTILEHFPEGQSAAGTLGVAMMACGVTGAVLVGYLLDCTRKYKETCVGLYVLAGVSLAGYTLLLEAERMSLLYVTAALIGFFMIGYLPAGFELGVELTYPAAQSTSASVLALGTQIFAFAFTLVYAAVLVHGAAASNWSMCGLLGLGSVLSALTRSNLRRQTAEQQSKSS